LSYQSRTLDFTTSGTGKAKMIRVMRNNSLRIVTM